MDVKPASKILKVNNRIDELVGIENFLQELGDEWELSPSIIFSFNLVIEEAFTNTVSYGYDDTNNHLIEIEVERKGDEIKISIIDDGHEYNPTLKAEPDITLPAEDRPIGGLGIFLIKKIMDKAEYKRIENRNHLILTKNIKS